MPHPDDPEEGNPQAEPTNMLPPEVAVELCAARQREGALAGIELATCEVLPEAADDS